MNGGGFKGEAYWLTIDSISEFVGIKSRDSKINFIDYIVSYIYNQMKDEELLLIIIKNLKNLEIFNIKMLQKVANNIQSIWKC